MIERAAILAEGADFAAVMTWITAHDGAPDATVSATRSRGLHGSRMNGGDATASRDGREEPSGVRTCHVERAL